MVDKEPRRTDNKSLESLERWFSDVIDSTVLNKVRDEGEALCDLEIKKYRGGSFLGPEVTAYCDLPHGLTSFRDAEVAVFLGVPPGKRKEIAVLYYSDDGLMRLTEVEKQAVGKEIVEKVGDLPITLMIGGVAFGSELSYSDAQKLIRKVKQIAS